MAGIGGSFLSLYYPGSWNEGLSSGQGLMAVALVVFSRWNPINCIYASLLFGAAALWRRMVLRYVQDSRRRHQLLLVRRIALWSMVVIVVGGGGGSVVGGGAVAGGATAPGASGAVVVRHLGAIEPAELRRWLDQELKHSS